MFLTCRTDKSNSSAKRSNVIPSSSLRLRIILFRSEFLPIIQSSINFSISVLERFIYV